ncbi:MULTISPECIES: hypothetical protein, partial [unclassified Caballeronia]|uniref:hypothetical protein n=1 Tax=unclassified Caballeronia TaxID=2646786 RepID=UPI00202912A5
MKNRPTSSMPTRHRLRVLPLLWGERQAPLGAPVQSSARRAPQKGANFFVRTLVAAVWLLSGKVEAQGVLPSTPHVVGGQANIQVNGSHMNVT